MFLQVTRYPYNLITFLQHYIIQMSNKRKSPKHDYQPAAQDTSRSDESLSSKPLPSSIKKEKKDEEIKKGFTNQQIGGAIILILVLLSGGYYYYYGPIVQQPQYVFKVYCPIEQSRFNLSDFGPGFIKAEHKQRANQLRLLTSQFVKVNPTALTDDVQDYMIVVQMRDLKHGDNTTTANFMYCSYVTDWENRDCSKSYAYCSTPGPIFYVPRDKPIDVACVN